MTPRFRQITILFLALTLCLPIWFNGLARAGATEADKARRAVEEIKKQISKRFPDVPEIQAEHLTGEVLAQVVLVDVRSADEMAVSMLPGAITFSQLKKDFKTLSNRVIIAYCTTGFRSAKLVRSFNLYGIKSFSLSGGILAWVHANGKIFDSRGETRRVHVYSDEYQVLPPGYEAVQ